MMSTAWARGLVGGFVGEGAEEVAEEEGKEKAEGDKGDDDNRDI